MLVLADVVTTPFSTIEKTVLTKDSFGNCLVLINRDISQLGLNCPVNNGKSYLSFDCEGNFIAKDISSKMFEAAQMAMVLEKNVQIQIDDSLKINGICVAIRIDLNSSN
jgi:hypothetical protein